jgi:hypothetical protein
MNSPETQLKIVNGVIDALEKTLKEFQDPKTKAELYHELAGYTQRQDRLEEELGIENPQANNSVIDIDMDPNSPEVPLEMAAEVEEALDDDPDLPSSLSGLAEEKEPAEEVERSEVPNEVAENPLSQDLVDEAAGESSFDVTKSENIEEVVDLIGTDEATKDLIKGSEKKLS